MKQSLAARTGAGLRARIRVAVCRGGGLVASGLALLFPTQSAAQGFNAEAFEPIPVQEGSILSVSGTTSLPRNHHSLTLFASYARHPLALENEQTGETLGQLTGSIATLSMLAGFGIWDSVDLGLAIPLHRISAGSDFSSPPPEDVQAHLVSDSVLALGDVRIVPRWTALQRGASGFGVAVLAPVSLPTGSADRYVGDSLRVEPRVAVDWKGGPVLLAANLGYLFRDERTVLGSTIDDSVRWGLGADVSPSRHVAVLLETFGSMHPASGGFSRRGLPVEAMAGVRYRRSGWMAQVGGGPGVVSGLTAPQYRLFASVGYAPERDAVRHTEPLDADHDGIDDSRDRCPLEAEDWDQFQDDDGCPDLDNDGDGIVDTLDSCPNEAEDSDGFQDDDGCPDADNDGDGVLDTIDQCPNEAGVQEHYGCTPPAEPPSSVQVEQQTIDLNQTVRFARGSSKLESESLSLMDELAEVLKAHPELRRVLVEGHADDLGGVALNARLSRERAEAVVRALVERGVESARLRAEGRGSERPLVSNDSEEQRAKNRRVELHIEERAER